MVQTGLYSITITFQFGHPRIYIYYVYDMYRHVCTMYVHHLLIHSMKAVYYVHVLHTGIHVYTVYVHLHILYMGTTDCLHTPLHYMPVCTALVIWMYYAIVQESAVVYTGLSEVSAMYIAIE
jgi:hypothetical protein